MTTLRGWVLTSAIGWGRVFFDEEFWRAERAMSMAFADPWDIHAGEPEIVREKTSRWLERSRRTTASRFYLWTSYESTPLCIERSMWNTMAKKKRQTERVLEPMVRPGEPIRKAPAKTPIKVPT